MTIIPTKTLKAGASKRLTITEKEEQSYIHKETVNGETKYLQTTKMPFVIPSTGKTGLFGIQFDVTEIEELREKVKKLEK